MKCNWHVYTSCLFETGFDHVMLQFLFGFEISLCNSETEAVYYFSNEHYTFAIPLPLGGKSADDFRFPSSLSTPRVSLPEFGLDIVSMEIPIPRFVIPKMVKLSIPLFGKAEASISLKSNLYNMEGSVSAGKEVGDTPSYSAKFDVKGTSPLDILSVNFEGMWVYFLVLTNLNEYNLISSCSNPKLYKRQSHWVISS